MVVAGLEAHVRRGPGRGRESLLERDDLGVWSTEHLVKALSHRSIVVGEHASDHRVGMDLSPTPSAEKTGALEKRRVLRRETGALLLHRVRRAESQPKSAPLAGSKLPA